MNSESEPNTVYDQSSPMVSYSARYPAKQPRPAPLSLVKPRSTEHLSSPETPSSPSFESASPTFSTASTIDSPYYSDDTVSESFPSSRTLASPSPRRYSSAGDLSHLSKVDKAHPYARHNPTMKDSPRSMNGSSKKRKTWHHALEKSIFTPYELSTLGAPHRRTTYLASLEAHVDALHAQLLNISLYPVPFERLEPFKGLNSKTAKSIVAGLQNDASALRMRHLQLERMNSTLRNPYLLGPGKPGNFGTRHASLDSFHHPIGQ